MVVVRLTMVTGEYGYKIPIYRVYLSTPYEYYPIQCSVAPDRAFDKHQNK